MASIDDAIVNEAIASAVGAILREGNFPSEMVSPPNITTQVGVAGYAISDTMGKIHRVWYAKSASQRIKLEFVPLDAFDDDYRYNSSVQSNGEPEIWTMEGGKVILHPTPDAAYTIAYRGERRSGDLANLPDEFRDAVILGALSVLLPAYLGAFRASLGTVKKYWRENTGRRREWRQSSEVQTHFDYRRRRNVA